MTREEEIKKEAELCASANTQSIGDWSAHFLGFFHGAEWADAHPHWISIEDELPKEKSWIIISTSFKSITCPAYHYEGEDIEELRSQGITHWMPMPEAPSSSEFPNNCEKGGEE